MSRVVGQVLLLLSVSAVLAVASSAIRSDGLSWKGSEPEAHTHRDFEWISVEEAGVLHADAMTLFLDARPIEQFDKRRIFGALSLPADDPEPAWEAIRDFLDPSMTLIVYSDDANLTVGTIRFLVARELPAKGLGGGWEAWRNARLPEERGH